MKLSKSEIDVIIDKIDTSVEERLNEDCHKRYTDFLTKNKVIHGTISEEGEKLLQLVYHSTSFSIREAKLYAYRLLREVLHELFNAI